MMLATDPTKKERRRESSQPPVKTMETTTVKLVSVYNGFLQLRVSLPRRLSLLMPKVFVPKGWTFFPSLKLLGIWMK